MEAYLASRNVDINTELGDLLDQGNVVNERWECLPDTRMVTLYKHIDVDNAIRNKRSNYVKQMTPRYKTNEVYAMRRVPVCYRYPTNKERVMGQCIVYPLYSNKSNMMKRFGTNYRHVLCYRPKDSVDSYTRARIKHMRRGNYTTPIRKIYEKVDEYTPGLHVTLSNQRRVSAKSDVTRPDVIPFYHDQSYHDSNDQLTRIHNCSLLDMNIARTDCQEHATNNNPKRLRDVYNGYLCKAYAIDNTTTGQLAMLSAVTYVHTASSDEVYDTLVRLANQASENSGRHTLIINNVLINTTREMINVVFRECSQMLLSYPINISYIKSDHYLLVDYSGSFVCKKLKLAVAKCYMLLQVYSIRILYPKL